MLANYQSITSRNLIKSYIAVLAGAFLVYAVSCAPSVLWQDSGMIQYRTWCNDIEGGLGLALSHPLFYILAIGAKYVHLGEFAYRVNLVSAIAGAVAIANLFLLLRLWLGRSFPAVIAAVMFGLSHTFWRHASIAETYTLYTALLLTELIMLLQYVKTGRIKFLYWLGLFNGLAISNHMFGSIPFLCYAVFVIVLSVKKDIHLKHLGIIVLLWVVGALPYEYLIIKNIILTGDFWPTLASAVFGASWQGSVLNASLSARIVKENILFILLNFPTPNALLFFAGCFGLFKLSPRRGFGNILVGLLILFFVFAFRYTVPDRYAFFIPFYCIASIFMGLGIYTAIEKKKSRILTGLILVFALLPVPVYAASPSLAEKMQFSPGTRSNIPYRNDYEYFLWPWKTGYCGAERFADEALDEVEDNAIIYADGTTVYPILLAQKIGGKRRDVTAVSGHGTVSNLKKYDEDVLNALFDKRAVYVVSPAAGYCPGFLLERYDFVRSGILYKVVERELRR